MSTTTTTAATMTTAQALSIASGLAAANSGQLVGLARLAESGILTADQFMEYIGKHPGTIGRDLDNARRRFRELSAAYETECKATGQAPYATYND